VCTGGWPGGFQALLTFPPHSPIEDDGFREVKEGWGRDAVRRQLTLTCLAFNPASANRLVGGQRLAKQGVRRLRATNGELGAAPVVAGMADCYAVLALEEGPAVLRGPVRESRRRWRAWHPANRRSPKSLRK
jgi:hypothetical protein